MSNVYLVEAEHCDVIGRLVEACATEQSADSKAGKIVALMLDQSGLKSTGDWKTDLARVQSLHNKESCYVAITPLAINP